VARTVAAFGRALDREPVPGKAVCMAFHDQTPILSLQEVAKKSSTPGRKKKRR
jgi:hypothetical protein